MLFTIPHIFDSKKTKTIDLNVVENRIVVTGALEASCSLRPVQDRLNEMVFGKHSCQPFLSFQEGGTSTKLVQLHIKRGEIVYSETVNQNGRMSTKTYIQRNNFSLDAAREFFGAKKLTPFLPEFAERRLEAALRQRLVMADGVYIDTVGQFGAVAVRWKHKAYAYKDMQFGRGAVVAPDSEYSWSIATIKSLGWAGAIRLCSYLLSLEVQERPHNQMLTYGFSLNWDLINKDSEFVSETLSLAETLEV